MTRIATIAIAAGLLSACRDTTEPLGESRRRGERAIASIDADAPHVEPGAPFILRGTVLTPDGVIKHGYVGIANGRIVAVSDKQPQLPEAVTLNTDGIIVPGFVDLHNHVPWNALPRWRPGRRFTNRNQWAVEPEYRRIIAGPFEHARVPSFCDMNAWGELRALVGGTTSILATDSVPCVHGLVRNLDYNSSFYGTVELDRERVINVLRLPPPDSAAARARFVGAAGFFIGNPRYEGLSMHVAEGTDAAAEEEFAFLQSRSLLNPKGILIHGISLGASDFLAMAETGTALVWSPRSNIELYGTTANLTAALDAGVEIALAPDWAITGSSNMLDELKTADQWNREQLGGRLTDRQLVDMVTSVPARVAGVDDEVGVIRPGLRADVVLISGDHNAPYRAVIDADPSNVQLVVLDGTALYGERAWMERFWGAPQLEPLPSPQQAKVLATPAAGVVIAGIAARLQAALGAEGTSLARLTEP